jgi:hypothetical protein
MWFEAPDEKLVGDDASLWEAMHTSMNFKVDVAVV